MYCIVLFYFIDKYHPAIPKNLPPCFDRKVNFASGQKSAIYWKSPEFLIDFASFPRLDIPVGADKIYSQNHSSKYYINGWLFVARL
ncbi:MAG: hypothetical protein ACI934_002279, partial [Pseudohongiellaceae bacterium]